MLDQQTYTKNQVAYEASLLACGSQAIEAKPVMPRSGYRIRVRQQGVRLTALASTLDSNIQTYGSVAVGASLGDPAHKCHVVGLYPCSDMASAKQAQELINLGA